MNKEPKERLVNLTLKLISFPSTKDNARARKNIINFIKKYLSKEKVFFREYESRQFPSLVITLKKEKNPDILLVGHLDVVPAAPADFQGKVKQGRIYGRGAGDMKAAVAVMIETLKYFARQKPKLSLGLMLTTDEEIGGFNGVGYLLKQKKYKPKLAFIPDGGHDLSTIVFREKGVLHLKIKAKGKAAHAARPFWGDNALEKLIVIYLKLKEIIPDLKEGQWLNSMTLSKISGGQAINQVPAQAQMYLDIRFIDQKNEEKIMRQIKKITSSEILARAPAFFQPKNHKYIKLYKRQAEKIIGKKISFVGSEGASDARFFSEQNIPTIITKINCGHIHADKEWVEIKEMFLLWQILINFLTIRL